MNPEFVIFTGPMFGGKTTKMLASLERARYRKKKIVLFKPRTDDRYSINSVMSHNGISWEAVSITAGTEIYTHAKDADIVAVDEAFMISHSGRVLVDLFRSGKSIYVSSIQLSSACEPFSEMAYMFPWATKIEVCPAVCPVTGLDAYYTIAKKKTEKFEVGGEETYEPRCFEESNAKYK